MKVTSYKLQVTSHCFWIFLFAVGNLQSASFSFGQVASPDVKCMSVAANGNVTLTWVTPASSIGFLDYQISSSLNPAGPYTLVATVTTFSQTSYTDFTANANTKEIFYLVQSEYNPGTGNVLSAPADTFSTIFLKVTNPGTGSAVLNWNPISLHPISTSSGWYKIYMEHPIGTWTLHDSIQSNAQTITYTDKFHVCNDSLIYRIEIADNITACTSVSNVTGKTIIDNNPPITAPIDTVSVNAANLATISWNLSPSPDVDSVIIYKGATSLGPWNQIAIVPEMPNFYTYLLSTAGTNSELYRVAFLDSCGNPSAQVTEHQTIYLTASFDPCAGTADLVWNKYINMSPAVIHYEVLRSVNAGAYNLVADLPANDSTYTDTGLVIGTPYCYIIRATDGVKSSSSNNTCFTPSVVNPPAFTYNRFATVKSNTSILITGYVDAASTSVTNYQLKRAKVPGGVFSVITTIPKPAGSAISYTDNTVNTQTESYSYKWEAMNSCNKVIMTSNIDTTILMNASVAPNEDVTLSWNDYGTFLGGVDHYEIYRAVDGAWDISPIASVPYSASGGTYTDDVSTFCGTSTGVFSYYILAIEGNGNPYSFKDSSRSNVAVVYEYPQLFIPNTFTPNGDGLNDIFIPVVCFINPKEYSLDIYDNYGYPVMESTDPTVGWDGKKKGHKCQEGVYMYVISCAASNGNTSRIAGTISLIR